jgi:pimeloyl-ACP methyl ester carboxylesterase
LRVRGLAIYQAGERGRPTVLLVHGYPDTHAVWNRVIGRLAVDHHVVAYDTRGSGASHRPRGDAAYDLVELADDMAAVIDAVSPGRPVHLVGHDWGSMEAWELCTTARADSRVASFTSISGPCLDHAGRWLAGALASRSPAALAAVAGQASRSWYMAALGLPGVARVAWPLFARFPSLLARVAGQPLDAAPTLAADGIAGAARYRRNVRARVRHPRPDARARMPVQLVVPDRDRFVAPPLLDEVRAWCPSLTVRHLDAAHWVPRTHPDALAALIAEFTSTCRRTSAR